MRKKIHDSQRLQSTEAARGRSASVRMNSRSPRNNIKILSEEDLNTKKWLDIKIADINAREDAVDTLRKQFEQQLALLNRKETLERERTTMKSMRSVVTCQSKSQLNAEEEEAMQEIEDRIESVEGQLKLRNRNITEIQSKLGGDGTGQEVTVEALRSSIGSLPAAQELITLLFDMLVNSKATAKQRKTALVRVEGKEKQLRIDLDDAGKRMNALIRAHDMELTRSANEYEDKMLGLFSHSTIGQIVRMESEMRPTDSTDSAINILANLSMEEPGAFSAQNSFSVAGRHSLHNESANKIIVAASNEHSNLLKAKLDRESRRNAELQIQISELTHGTLRFHQEIEEKNVLIKFLEDERTLFRDMADRMRAGISVLGGTAGEAILSQLKEDNDSDEDCEGFKGEFTNLGDIIHRNGSVNERSTPTSTTAPGVSTAASRDVVYDRLTNPSNFTGAMKNAFGDDLLKKRQQVQMIKSSHPPKRINASHTRTDSIRITKDMVPILSEINAVPSSDSSPGTTVPASPRRSQTPQRTKDTLSAEMKFPVVIPPITLKETTNVKLNKHHTLSSSTLSSASSHYSSDESSANSSYASLKCDPSPPEVPTGSPRGSPITDQLKRNGSGSLTKHFETPNLQETQFIVQKEMVVDANEVDANEVDIDVEVEDIEDADVDIDVLESILPYILNEFPPTADPEQDQVIPLTVAVKSHIKGDESTPPSTPSPIVHKDIIQVAEFEKNDKIIPTPSSPRSEEADYESAISNVPPSNDSSPNTKRGIGGMMRKLWGKKKSFMGSPETDVTTSDIENGSSGKKGSLFQN